jgi:hypothetical protein
LPTVDCPACHVLSLPCLQLEPLLARCILPGLCLAPGLTIPCQKAWDLLQALPYQRRFLMYTRVWEVQREDPICVLAGQKAVEEVKRINRRSVASGDKWVWLRGRVGGGVYTSGRPRLLVGRGCQG